MEKKNSENKTVKMRFSVDQFYGAVKDGSVQESLDKPLYEAGKIYEVEESMVGRWLKRGGEIITDEILQEEKKEEKQIEKELDKSLEQELEKKDEPPVEDVDGDDKKTEDSEESESHKGKKGHGGKGHGKGHGKSHK